MSFGAAEGEGEGDGVVNGEPDVCGPGEFIGEADIIGAGIVIGDADIIGVGAIMGVGEAVGDDCAWAICGPLKIATVNAAKVKNLFKVGPLSKSRGGRCGFNGVSNKANRTALRSRSFVNSAI